MLSLNTNKIVLDLGNSMLKAAVFQDDEMISLKRYYHNELKDFFKDFSSIKSSKSILCSVAAPSLTQEIVDFVQPNIIFDQKTSVPIDLNKYRTKLTLGVDRIANMVYANKHTKGAALVVDSGSCVKFDLIKDSIYFGGSISPGLQMRFNALHNFTGNLPLLSMSNHKEILSNLSLIGDDTNSAMFLGTYNGWKFEIQAFLDDYIKKYKNLTIFLTGGDAVLLDSQLKNTIFVDLNLTLKGLKLILDHNER